MMDVSKLDLEHIELFALANAVAEQVYSVAPIQASPTKQTKIRKWVNKTYLDDNDLPQEVLRFVDNSRADLEFMQFLSACAEYEAEQAALKKQAFEDVIANFTDDVQHALESLFDENGCCESVENRGNQIALTVEDFCAFKRKLILHTSKENHIGNYNLLDFSDAQIIKDECGYRLICTAENYEEETSLPITIFFDGASTAIEIYRADRRDFDDNPWESLAFLASDILQKNDLGPEYFNEKELALMPLLKELRALLTWMPDHDEETPNFEILKQYIKKHDLHHLIPLLDKLAARDKDKSLSPLFFGRLSNALNDATCESIWRELYELLADSQAGYADKLLTYDQKKLNNIRSQIEKKFHSLGYEGRYPTFIKKGTLKGIRLEESYNQSYFVGPERDVRYIVECKEVLFGDMLHIQFICGTAFLKRGETVADIYSCCFNKKGRRIFKRLLWDADEMGSLAQFVTIAAKRAECTKLNKAERALLGNIAGSWRYFAFMFLITGGLFAILMTPAMLLVGCLMTIVFDGIGGVPDIVEYFPWWQIFVFCFVGGGGAMTIVDIKASRK